MKILMSGATGLIGQELGKALVRRGHRLCVLSRNANKASKQLRFPAEIFTWGGAGSPLPAAALRGVEALIHLAGEPIAEGRWTKAKKKRIRDSRVAGTEAVVQSWLNSVVAAADVGAENGAGLKVFVQGSAIGIYGDRGDTYLTEDALPGDDFLAVVCRDWEAAGRKMAEGPRGRSVRHVTIRTGVVLTPQGGALEKMLPVFRGGVGGRLGSGRQWMSWIHLDDIVGMFIHAVENSSVQGVLNGVAPQPVTNRDFTKELAHVLGRSAVFVVPASALRVGLGEMSLAVLGSQRCSAERAQASGYSFRYPELRGALASLLGDDLPGLPQGSNRGANDLVFEQWVPRPLSEVFPFFSDEKNLERLTPPFLSFHVLGKSTPEMTSGTIIDYRLRLHGVPLHWKSQIQEWEPGRKFVDTQIRGPYKSWHHTHEFESLGGGTLIRDRIRYQVPLGGLGRLVAGGKVAADVGRIFEYRRQVIGELFGDTGSYR